MSLSNAFVKSLFLLVYFAPFAYCANDKIDVASSSGLDTSNIQLASVKAAIFDPQNGQLLYAKNQELPAPIASITKMMTAMVVLDGGQDLDELLTIKKVKRTSSNNGYSRMRVDSQLSRGNLMLLALMASENLAASTLALHYDGGFDAFVAAMNAKANSLGMTNTQFVDASGLSELNISTAADLVKMITAASQYPKIREFTTTTRFTARFKNPRYSLNYGNTNRLVRRQSWDVTVSKTGYLNEAGRCLVMITEIDNREIAMVLLDSFGKLSPIGDAGRVKRWLTTGNGGRVAGAALRYEQDKTKQLSTLISQ